MRRETGIAALDPRRFTQWGSGWTETCRRYHRAMSDPNAVTAQSLDELLEMLPEGATISRSLVGRYIASRHEGAIPQDDLIAALTSAIIDLELEVKRLRIE